MQKYVLYIIAIVIMVSVMLYNPFKGNNTEDLVYGKVIRELDLENENSEGYIIRDFEIQVLNGKYKGSRVVVKEMVDEAMLFYDKTEVGKSVVLQYQEEDNKINDAHIVVGRKDDTLKQVVILFLISIIVVGGLKGIKSLISLVITIVLILKLLLPKLLIGGNPLFWTVIVSVIITVISIIIISGFNKKSLASILGTTFGTIFAGLIAYYYGNAMSLTGAAFEEAKFLMFTPQNVVFDFKGLLFSGIVLGSLGAVMDVSMSIASSIIEIEKANPKLSVVSVFNSGMNIGKDIMGTMTNTLILAYTGTAIYLMLLMMSYDTPMVSILNNDLVVTEILRALSGTIGLIFTIPITAILAASIGKLGLSKKI